MPPSPSATFFHDPYALILAAISLLLFVAFVWSLLVVARRGDVVREEPVQPWAPSSFTSWDCADDLRDAA